MTDIDKQLDFNTDPSEFPEVWHADETVSIDAIINKHVYLSLLDAATNYSADFDLSEDGKFIISVCFADPYFFTINIDLEELVELDIQHIADSPSEIRAFAASLRRVVEFLEKKAGEAE